MAKKKKPVRAQTKENSDVTGFGPEKQPLTEQTCRRTEHHSIITLWNIDYDLWNYGTLIQNLSIQSINGS